MRIAEDSRLTDRRVTEWFLLEQARHKEEPIRKQPPRALPVITISRQFGAGGHTVAAQAAALLGEKWQIWDKEIIESIAHSAQVRAEMVEAMDERTRSWMAEMVGSLLNVRALEAHAYHRHLVEALLALAQQGYKIIVGRGANFVLPNALNVRLRAGLEYRVRATMQRENIPREEALRQVQHVDRDRAEFTRSLFGHEIDDPAGYDMILQTDTLGMDASAAALVAAAQAMFEGGRK